MNVFQYFFYALIFAITLIGIKIYRNTVLNTFPSLIRKSSSEKSIVNGAGSIIWDVFLLFCIYLNWHKGISFNYLIVFLISSLLFTLLGWVDDLIELKPIPKLVFQFITAIISIFLYFKVKGISFNYITFLMAILYFVWLVNSINFIDILDGLAGSVSMVLMLSFSYVFYKTNNAFGFEYTLFWIIVISAFLTQNIKNPVVYLGDAGAHLIGTAVFFAGMEFIFAQKSEYFSIISLILNHTFLIFDFGFVCFIRYIKSQSLLLKSNDHFTFYILNKFKSHYKTIFLIVFLQILASLTFIIAN